MKRRDVLRSSIAVPVMAVTGAAIGLPAFSRPLYYTGYEVWRDRADALMRSLGFAIAPKKSKVYYIEVDNGNGEVGRIQHTTVCSGGTKAEGARFPAMFKTKEEAIQEYFVFLEKYLLKYPVLRQYFAYDTVVWRRNPVLSDCDNSYCMSSRFAIAPPRSRIIYPEENFVFAD